MIDPMADIDNPSAVGGGSGDIMDGSSPGGDGGDNSEVFNMNAYRSNLVKMDKIRSFMGIASGCVAGVCGLTGLAGLVCFLVLHIVVNISLLGVKMNFELHTYTRESIFAFLTADLQKCAMSFMLFWTLFYGLVYLF